MCLEPSLVAQLEDIAGPTSNSKLTSHRPHSAAAGLLFVYHLLLHKRTAMLTHSTKGMDGMLYFHSGCAVS
jgi:hypothetical protein